LNHASRAVLKLARERRMAAQRRLFQTTKPRARPATGADQPLSCPRDTIKMATGRTCDPEKAARPAVDVAEDDANASNH
jgi:hypothetical protein